jgi:ATP-binding cassette subfamily B protein
MMGHSTRVETLFEGGDADHERRLTPFERLMEVVRLERSDLLAIGLYVILIGVLALAVPLAAQALVNTIAAGVFIQPLVVLTVGVLGALIFAGILRLLKLSLLEKIQQRVFARISLQLAERLPRIKHEALIGDYAPSLVNRFFDVITIQKAVSKILLEGPSALLKVLIGLLLMSFYSPYLLAFSFLLILFVIFVVRVLGINGLQTSIRESQRKYEVADWLEDLARCQRGFKMSAAPSFAVERADDLVINYVEARRSHFQVIFRQAFGNYFFQAFANAGVLAIGGWLVIERQLTLGQVVASELVVVGVLDGLEKLIRLLESGYDMQTALEKIGHLTDLPLERRNGRDLPVNPRGAAVSCRKLRFSYRDDVEVLVGLDLHLAPGDNVSIVGESGAGKSTLAALLCGLYEPKHGIVQINGMDVRDANLESLRRSTALVSDANEIFEGTIEENILLGRGYLSHEDLQWALEFTRLTEELAGFPKGLQTKLVTEGRNLSRGQIQRLLLARAIVGRPQLLILDEGFTGIDENDKLEILDELFDPRHNWTIIDISHDPEVVMRSKHVLVMANGRIVESGAPKELVRVSDCEFSRIFPSLDQYAPN